MRVLVVGGGGREHALAWALAASPLLTKLWCAPGNPGIAEAAECVPIAATDIPGLVGFARDNKVDLVVAGPPSRVGEMTKDELAAALQPGLAPGLVEGFEGWLELGRYVRAGTDCPSLAGIRVEARRLGFEERRSTRQSMGQLRLWLYDAQGTRFNLPVAARWLKQVQRTSGLGALATMASAANSMVVRVGLADPLPDTRAYALVSNVIFS